MWLKRRERDKGGWEAILLWGYMSRLELVFNCKDCDKKVPQSKLFMDESYRLVCQDCYVLSASDEEIKCILHDTAVVTENPVKTETPKKWPPLKPNQIPFTYREI